MPISADSPAYTPPPGIGLALGGGVARGWAHIGALQRLEELGIKPDIVCGTSVGALVGGFWLAGRLGALETWTRGLNKRRMLSYLDIALNGSGLIGGKRLENTLTKYLPDILIEDLPSRFLAVTTELITGHEIWLRKGHLNEAIRAAYALPGIFPPNQIDGRWLIDGALVNPLPISACRAMGARLVIAVGLHAEVFSHQQQERMNKYRTSDKQRDVNNISSKPEKKKNSLPRLPGGFARNVIFNRVTSSANEQTPGLGEVMFSSFNIIMDRTTRARLAADPPDIMITPKVSHVPLFGFDEADELIKLGREAVDQQADEIFRAIKFLY